MTTEMSIRTRVRDAIVTALEVFKQATDARYPNAAISLSYDTVEECKVFPTYCVICTNEHIERQTHGIADDVSLDVLVVVYVRDEKDPRLALDRAIEDVWDALRRSQAAKSVVPMMAIETIETDEGTRVAKPFAQAVMRWRACGIRRSVTW